MNNVPLLFECEYQIVFTHVRVTRIQKLSKTLQFRIEPASQQQTHSRTILLLVMSRLATGFASSTVSDVFRKVLGALGCDGDSSTRGNTLVAVTGAMGDYGMEVDEVHRKCRQVSQV